MLAIMGAVLAVKPVALLFPIANSKNFEEEFYF